MRSTPSILWIPPLISIWLLLATTPQGDRSSFAMQIGLQRSRSGQGEARSPSSRFLLAGVLSSQAGGAMAKKLPAGIRDTRDLVRKVQSGALTRRDLFKLFGVSAAAFGLPSATGCGDDSSPYDYVIVGAGSAGCTLAARLLADSDARVLLIEAGGSNDLDEVKDFTQSYRLTLPDSQVDWGYKSEPQETLQNRVQSYSSGKVLGGSSSINGMVWVRG